MLLTGFELVAFAIDCYVWNGGPASRLYNRIL